MILIKKRGSVIVLKRGTLWSEITRRTEMAITTGALHPVPTEYEFIEDGGVRFFVRILSNLARKEEARKKQERQSRGGNEVNPFLPYEEDLFVADISETHVALLNKFNVVEHHLLIVTREFEGQEMLLTLKDFEALIACMSEYDSLGFYNGGEAAGASQKHKHLQMVPLPLAPEGPGIPVEPLLDIAKFDGDLGTVPGLPFRHAFVRTEADILQSAEKVFALYTEMIRRTGLDSPHGSRPKRQFGPYCLLVTRSWMLLVPRSREFFDSVSINSLGFAGALLVRDREQLKLMEKTGPMQALSRVAFPL
jgi:sulfate adenylyltransferase (ADP) / ATP adenylyltransferase